LRWSTPVLEVLGIRRARKQATRSWRRCTGRSAGRLLFMGIFIRQSQIREMLIINMGSVSLSYDGDARAAYLLIDNLKATIRRVECAVEKELKTLSACGLPHSDWVAKILRRKSPQLP
jgi:hypothetical protein